MELGIHHMQNLLLEYKLEFDFAIVKPGKNGVPTAELFVYSAS